MPVGKRTTKVVSYNEQDDDDDFVLVLDKSKKARNAKSVRSSTESKTSVQQSSEEKLAKMEPVLVKVVPLPAMKSPEKVIIEDCITIDEKESSTSQSSTSSDCASEVAENTKTSSVVIDEDEDLSPKTKRMKHEDEENEEEETIEQKPLGKTVENINIPMKPSIDLNISHPDHRNVLTRTSDLPKKRSTIPLGFPTSKINIHSPHMFRVGLSRKAASIKPLHPNINSRVAHE